MIDPEKAQVVVKQDALPLGLGGGFLGFASFAEATTFIQQLGIWFGTALVFITLVHRMYIFWKDSQK